MSVLLCWLSVNCNAQLVYTSYSAGIEGGATFAFMDAENPITSSAFGVTLDANVTPYSFFKLEFQTGKLEGGSETTVRQFTNKYNYIGVTYNQGLGDLLNFNPNKLHKFYKSIYAGLGLGLIFNNITDIKAVADSTQGISIYNKNNEIVFPLNIGYTYHYRTKTGLNPFSATINYQFTLSFSDVLDGYEWNPASHSKDFYGFVSLGVKYNFGKEQIYYRLRK
ncbi:hypothetical protein SAMN06265350_10413 [Solitalea koreensis]|uniref:Outer membrane protein beta-barrel domain-containing protein n=1 Tax=Solitalea koreensis TaxID=543615 RepID=A0A521CF45_9SPHI|nr:hypothetical protein SAMN06265350_10413 [Solitalea koreensis]